LEDTAIYLSDILAAQRRIRGKVLNTPMRRSDWLSDVSDAAVYLKLENLQTTSSFKLRGATNALQAARESGQTHVYTASAGNHGIAVAEASRHVETTVTVCVPSTVSPLKLQKIKQYNVGVIQHGEECQITESYARRLAKEKKALYLSPYNDPEVIAGQGTIALEMLEAVPDLTRLIVSVGGGGLISGIAVAAKAINPSIRITGVVAANFPTMKECIRANRIIPVMYDDTIADGISGNIDPDSITFPLAKELVDDWVAVEEKDIADSIYDFLSHENMLIEGAASVCVAAITRKLTELSPLDKVGVVICGGNISAEVWQPIIRDRMGIRV
jgi:threonine dehydratase